MQQIFLKEVAVSLSKLPVGFEDLILVVPNIRSGVFLKEIIRTTYSEQTFLLPQIISIEELIAEISQLGIIDPTVALFEFYKVYSSVEPETSKESFDVFSNWAQTVLQDFSEVDRNLVEPAKFFGYLSDIQEVEHWSLQTTPSPITQRYINFWNKLPLYYTHFTQRLLLDKKGYNGLRYRVAVEKLDQYVTSHQEFHYFIGLNALNKAEETIIHKLLDINKAEIIWDLDHTFYQDQGHAASLFIRKYTKNWTYYKDRTPRLLQNNFSTPKDINIVGTPKFVGQAKFIGDLLSTLPPDELDTTAIILPDESMLIPLLNSIPKHIEAINITMGLPLVEVPLASFFELLTTVQATYTEQGIYYKNVLKILYSQPVQKLLSQDARNLINAIRTKNLVYIKLKDLLAILPEEKHSIIRLFFAKRTTPIEIIKIFQQIIRLLKNNLQKDDAQLDLEHCYRFHVIFNKLFFLQEKYQLLTNLDGLHRVYRQLLREETLDYKGEPFKGLQIMGLLESRCLDFSTIIIASVNEGVLPAGKTNNSFIPYDLKRSHGIPTFIEKDAESTYHFFRVLQRAKKAYLLYNTNMEGLNSGEKSRFLMQLELLPQAQHTIRNYTATLPITQTAKQTLSIVKDQQILEKLKSLALSGFSPSALTTYIRNPLDFYHRYVLDIKEQDKVEEVVAANTLGTIIHNTLETFYKPYEGKNLVAQDVQKMKAAVEKVVQHEFRSVYATIDITSGKNLLIFEVAKRYLLNFLDMEVKQLESGNTIEIVAIETSLKVPFVASDHPFPIFLKGIIDRVDRYNGQLRIIDYKTSMVKQSEVSVKNWEALIEDAKYAKAFQIITYSYMLLSHKKYDSDSKGGIISFKNLKSGFLPFSGSTENGAKPIALINEAILNLYQAQLTNLVKEIFSPTIPFTERKV